MKPEREYVEIDESPKRISSTEAFKVFGNLQEFKESKPSALLYAGIIQYKKQMFSCNEIIKLVCESLGIELEYIKRRSRKREIVFARQIAMTMCCKYTAFSLNDIGNSFITMENPKGYDHATILHAKKTIADLKQTSKEVKSKVDNVEQYVVNGIIRLNESKYVC
jgi:chromosomal replication initiation ATPase DnaA